MAGERGVAGTGGPPGKSSAGPPGRPVPGTAAQVISRRQPLNGATPGKLVISANHIGFVDGRDVFWGWGAYQD